MVLKSRARGEGAEGEGERGGGRGREGGKKEGRGRRECTLRAHFILASFRGDAFRLLHGLQGVQASRLGSTWQASTHPLSLSFPSQHVF